MKDIQKSYKLAQQEVSKEYSIPNTFKDFEKWEKSRLQEHDRHQTRQDTKRHESN